MDLKEKFDTLSQLLKQNDFSYISSVWSSLTSEEKTRFKIESIVDWDEETVRNVYKAFCFVNKSLADEILGHIYKKENKISNNLNNLNKKNIKEGKEREPWEEYIDFKVEYLQAFKAKLEAGGFNQDLILLLLAQELAHLNHLSLGGKGNEQT
jgi:hypothetical protein